MHFACICPGIAPIYYSLTNDVFEFISSIVSDIALEHLSIAGHKFTV